MNDQMNQESVDRERRTYLLNNLLNVREGAHCEKFSEIDPRCSYLNKI